MLKILIVDDEQLERSAIRAIVEKSGLPLQIVGEASNGIQALEAVRSFLPEILFVDIKMPCMNGLDLVRQVNQIIPKAKIVVVSAYDTFDYAQEAVELGVVEYLLKPARSQEIFRVLSKLIELIQEQTKREMLEERQRKQLEFMLPYIRSAYMVDLLYGHGDGAALTERARFLGFLPVPSVILLIDIDKFILTTETMREGERQLLKQEVFHAVEHALEADNPQLALPIYGDKILVLLGVSAKMRERDLDYAVLVTAEKIRQSVAQRTNCTCTIGVGNCCEDVSDIPASYKSITKSMELGKLFLGENRIIHVNEVEHLQNAYTWYPFQKEKALTRQLVAGSQKDFQSLLSAFTQALYEKRDISVSQMRIRLFELVILLSRAAVDAGVGPEAIEAAEIRFQKELIKADDNNALIKTAYQASLQYRSLLTSLYQSNAAECVRKAIAFLEENYRQDISLAQVAEVVALNPDYFSRIFKKEAGMNFIDYLTMLRMDRAKQMLLQTSHSIAEISSHVGYRDTNYFRRVFLKSVGVTPTDFRTK